MTVLQIYMGVDPEKADELKRTYEGDFVPAISRQEGFRRLSLLAPAESGGRNQIALAFAAEELRQKWVASDEHEEVFPKIKELCREISYERFEVLGDTAGA